jgi:hypothetical protein
MLIDKNEGFWGGPDRLYYGVILNFKTPATTPWIPDRMAVTQVGLIYSGISQQRLIYALHTFKI